MHGHDRRERAIEVVGIVLWLGLDRGRNFPVGRLRHSRFPRSRRRQANLQSRPPLARVHAAPGGLVKGIHFQFAIPAPGGRPEKSSAPRWRSTPPAARPWNCWRTLGPATLPARNLSCRWSRKRPDRFKASICPTKELPDETAAVRSVQEGMVQLGGFEPPTSGSTDRRSNHLSYSCKVLRAQRAPGT